MHTAATATTPAAAVTTAPRATLSRHALRTIDVDITSAAEAVSSIVAGAGESGTARNPAAAANATAASPASVVATRAVRRMARATAAPASASSAATHNGHGAGICALDHASVTAAATHPDRPTQDPMRPQPVVERSTAASTAAHPSPCTRRGVGGSVVDRTISSPSATPLSCKVSDGSRRRPATRDAYHPSGGDAEPGPTGPTTASTISGSIEPSGHPVGSIRSACDHPPDPAA